MLRIDSYHLITFGPLILKNHEEFLFGHNFQYLDAVDNSFGGIIAKDKM